MTISEWLLLAQTLILLLTGLVVLWYTKETARIRKETSKQASLLAEQVTLLRSQIERENRRDVSYVQPAFKMGNGIQTDRVSSWAFKNVGAAAITHLRASSSGYSVTVNPSHYLGPDEEMIVKIERLPRPTPDFAFELQYRDKLGVQHRRLFTYSSATGRFEDHEEPSNDSLEPTGRPTALPHQ